MARVEVAMHQLFSTPTHYYVSTETGHTHTHTTRTTPHTRHTKILDATSGLLAAASASAPAMFLALRSALLCTCV